MKTHIIEALVWAAVGCTVFFSWGMLRMRDAYQQIHFTFPPASFAAPLLGIAIMLQQGAKPETFKALFIVLVLLTMNSIMSHATARAFRVRAMAEWSPAAGQEVPVAATDEVVSP